MKINIIIIFSCYSEYNAFIFAFVNKMFKL